MTVLDGAVASGLLGLIQRKIGAFDQLFARCHVRGEFDHADADGDMQGLAVLPGSGQFQFVRFDAPAHPFGQVAGGREARIPSRISLLMN